ncbi:MAG: ABC transporter permease [Dehalococcoidia bacterium]|nr:ABC transporter permease [Dehalococcoidia bacterium]
MVDSQLDLTRRRFLQFPSARVPAILLRFARRKPVGAFSASVILVMLFVALAAPWIAPYPYDQLDIPARLQGPSLQHFAGTDVQGRDVFSRVLFGANTSVIVGFGAVIFSTLLASTIGIISGYKSGLFDTLVQRVVDVWQSFPGLIFVIFLVAILGASRPTLIVTMGLLFSAGTSRLVRGATIAISSESFVDAARSLGATDLRIWLRHVLPNVFPVILISMSLRVGGAIILESSLSFLGYGTPPPYPSWGGMLQESQSHMIEHPNLAVVPGLAIAIAVYSFNMFGDALRDVLDPRLRGGR